eukprot:4183012-Alexandrium_andersonii.AAC.1
MERVALLLVNVAHRAFLLVALDEPAETHVCTEARRQGSRRVPARRRRPAPWRCRILHVFFRFHL